MAEVLRLLRLSLILRIVVSVLSAIALGLATSSSGALVGLMATLPSVALLIVTFIALSRGRTDARFVKGLLAATVIIQTLEETGVRLLLRPEQFNTSDSDFPPRGLRSGAELVFTRGLFGGALFTAIPAILGAWISGKRGAFRWAAFAIGFSALGDVVSVLPNLATLRFVLGSVASQGIVIALAAYFVGSLADQQRDEQKQLEAANRKLAEQGHVREQLAVSRERVRLARDLHDTLAHTLAGLVVQMNAIATLLKREPDAAQHELVRAQATAKQGLEETRLAISDLRANMVEDLGLGGALQRQAEMVGQRGGANVTYEQSGGEPQLDIEKSETLFRIVQEALNNVERHAQAHNIVVSMRAPNGATDGAHDHQNSVVLSVKDDGVGFNLAELDNDRFGLRGMRERADLIGAHLRVDSVPGTGTQVTVTLKQGV